MFINSIEYEKDSFNQKLPPHALRLNKLEHESWELNNGKGSNQIATEQEAYAIGGKGSPVANKCLTQGRVSSFGCKTSITSTNSNQLVVYSRLSKAVTSLGTCELSGFMSSSPSGVGYEVSADISGSGYTAKSGVTISIEVVYDTRFGGVNYRSISLGNSTFSDSWNSGMFISNHYVSGPITSVRLISITDGYDIDFTY